MAFFRKTKKTEDVLSDIKAKAESESHQSKWDALERMISEGHDSPNAETPNASTVTSSEIDPKTDALTSASLDLNAYKTQSASSASISPELKIDLPDDSNFVDVTPKPETESVGAMLPSKSFGRTASKEGAVSSRGTVDDKDSPTTRDSFIPPPPAMNKAMRADIGAMRLDVARISADIQSGEELYRRAQQRIENLTGFVERAEVDFSLLNRLEPENRRLKARNRTIEREIEASTQKMNVLRAELEDREHRLADKTRVYENAVGKLSVAKKSLQEYERALNTSRERRERLEAQVESQAFQLDQANAEILQTKQDVTDFDRRYRDVATALSVAQARRTSNEPSVKKFPTGLWISVWA